MKRLIAIVTVGTLWLGGLKHGNSATVATVSDSPLPRFVSLRANKINLRAGPGTRYPIEWVFVRRGLPVEIISEFDIWRKIRDPQGEEGWVHQSMLSGERSFIITVDTAKLRRTADAGASAAAWLKKGVFGKLLQCPKKSAFCRVEVKDYQGWLRRSEFWGSYKGEEVR